MPSHEIPTAPRVLQRSPHLLIGNDRVATGKDAVRRRSSIRCAAPIRRVGFEVGVVRGLLGVAENQGMTASSGASRHREFRKLCVSGLAGPHIASELPEEGARGDATVNTVLAPGFGNGRSEFAQTFAFEPLDECLLLKVRHFADLWQPGRH